MIWRFLNSINNIFNKVSLKTSLTLRIYEIKSHPGASPHNGLDPHEKRRVHAIKRCAFTNMVLPDFKNFTLSMIFNAKSKNELGYIKLANFLNTLC